MVVETMAAAAAGPTVSDRSLPALFSLQDLVVESMGVTTTSLITVLLSTRSTVETKRVVWAARVV